MSRWSHYPTIAARGDLILARHPNGPVIIDTKDDLLLTVGACVERVSHEHDEEASADIAQWIALELWKLVPA